MKKFNVERLKDILNCKIDYYKERIELYMKNDHFTYDSIKDIVIYYNLIDEVSSILKIIEAIENVGV